MLRRKHPSRVSNAKASLGALADGCHVDVVFFDVMMPGGISGLDLARHIRDRGPSLPRVLASAYAEAVKQGAHDAGIAVLPKPFVLAELGMALRQARS